MDKTPTDEMKENEYTLEGQARQQALERLEGMNAYQQDLEEQVAEQQLAEEEENSKLPSTKPTPTTKKETPEKKPKATKPKNQTTGKGGLFGTGIGEGLSYLGQPLDETDKQVEERLSAPGQGLFDFGTSAANFALSKLEKFGVPQIPTAAKYENEEAQVVRNLASIVLPSYLLGKPALGGATRLQASLGPKLGKLGQIGNDIAFKRFAQTGLSAGIGAGVDYIAPVNSEDHNALGEMKKAWPQTWGFVSDDFATLDSDSPEIKRQKNAKEGVLLSLGADVIVAGVKTWANRNAIKRLTTWLPENEQAKTVTDRLNAEKAKIETPEDVIIEGAKRRTEDMDELGAYGVAKSVNLDEKPIFGYHDLYNDMEMGMRSADPGGVLGASVDVVKINGNIDTIYGRLGSVFTEGALKFGLEADEGAQVLIKGLGDQLTEAGEYGYRTSNGRYLSFAEISEAGDNLAADLMNMDVATMKRTLDAHQFVDGETGAKVLTSSGYNAAFKAINKYLKEFASVDQAKAYAYASTSLGGQISDMAEAARLVDGSVAVGRAQEEILDRIEFLMAAKAQTSYVRGRALNMTNIWNRAKNWSKDQYKQMFQLAEAETDSVPQALRAKAEEAKQTVETLRNVSRQRPELLGPLMLAWEHTDGNINSMHKLNEYVRNSTGTLSKAFFDANTEIPSAWIQGVWGNIYNSVLSSMVTPIKAGASNAVILIERPVATFLGAAINEGITDSRTIRRGIYQYRAFADTFSSAFKHMNEVYKRAAKDPSAIGSIVRDDIARKNERTMEILNATADAFAEKGELGPAAMVGQIEEMNALADHPWLRFGPNAMSAFDGFTRSVIGSVEARGRAFDMVNASNGALNPDLMDTIADKTYKAMFDKNGMITDKAVDYASREIAMNLDNNASKALSELLRDAPAFKPFVMFPRTSMNMALFAGSHNPLGLLPAKTFQQDVHKFSRKFENMPIEEVEALLTSRGLKFDSTNIESIYSNIAAEMKGRKAIGALAVFTAGGMFMAGNLTGDGHFDKETQAARRDYDWKPRTVTAFGKRVTYADLGPVSDWIALTANVMDNIVDGTLTTGEGTGLLNKMGFILSSSVTSKSVMAGLEPMNDVLSGNTAALARWGASFGSGLAPLSGLRNDMSRLMTPQLKELEQEMGSLISNRNPILKESLHDKHDYIDGGLIGVPSPWTRIWNTFTPWKVNDAISDEKQFLIDIEFDRRPSLSTNGRGVPLTAEQKSAVAEKMGEQKVFLKKIKEIMATTDGRRFREEFKRARAANQEIDIRDFQMVHYKLNQALSGAVDYAIGEIDEDLRGQIRKEEYRQNQIATATKKGDVEALEQLTKYNYE